MRGSPLVVVTSRSLKAHPAYGLFSIERPFLAILPYNTLEPLKKALHSHYALKPLGPFSGLVRGNLRI